MIATGCANLMRKIVKISKTKTGTLPSIAQGEKMPTFAGTPATPS